ncbi:MAG: hypothetical protein QOD88_2943 [Mycobacterium sp.]|nr:hypothetical protein [Mycobacterium sp.]
MSVTEAASGPGDESVESTELAPGADGFHLKPRCRICRNDQVRTKVNDLLAAGASYPWSCAPSGKRTPHSTSVIR